MASAFTSAATTAKPLPRLAGAGGLDRRVESQEVRLAGDVVDEADDLAHVLGRFLQAVDGFVGSPRLRDGTLGEVGALAHALRYLPDRKRQLAHRRRHRLDVEGRILGARAAAPD